MFCSAKKAAVRKVSKVKVDGTGFIGIDAEFSLALPENVLGSFVSNAPGLFANVTINTIENVYELNAGLSLKIIECEGTLAFKQVNVKSKDVILPDKIEFYIRGGIKVPLAPPVLYLTGLGGGINELADTIGGEFTELPPITILLYTKLEAIGILEGEFNAKISLSGLTLSGDLTIKKLEDILDLDAEINARWVEPWELSLCGNVNVIDGLIKGGITVTIADDYFYGYVFASICVPDSIPFVGGKELRKVEAAVSHEFIGANIKIIGIKLGVIYYWGDKVSFGKNVDLSAPERKNTSGENGGMTTYSLNSMGQDYSNADAVGYYGTNVYALSTENFEPITLNSTFKSKEFKIGNTFTSSALLLEIPFTGAEPSEDDVKLKKPNGDYITLKKDDNTGNMLVQDINGEKCIYITVTDKSLIESGQTWTFEYDSTKLDVSDIKVNGVDDIPELTENSAAITVSGYETTVEWKVDGAKAGDKGTVDIYLNEDGDIKDKIENETISDSLGRCIYHMENVDLTDEDDETGKSKATVTLPDTTESGEYYAVVVLSTDNGISVEVSEDSATFTNPKLPKAVNGLQISYGGNGGIFVKVDDAKDSDYTHYLAEIIDENGKPVENSLSQFERGSNFTIGREALLKDGESYKVRIQTLREEKKQSTSGSDKGAFTTHYYYGSVKTSNESVTMPTEHKIPVLKSVKVNFDTSADDINTNVKDVVVEYEFENEVFVEMDLNGSKVYAFGENPVPNAKDTYFKRNWRFVLDDLDDGDYVVDFTAFSDNKDYVKGSSIADVENATFAFTVDTSAPVLSLAQNSVTRTTEDDEGNKEEITVVFGANTVTADENGVYKIEGITEKTAKIELDGAVITAETEGVEIANNGSFTITKTLPTGKTHTDHRITVTDKAGNVSEANVWVVSKSGFSYDELKLYLDGKEVKSDANGVKKITLKNAQRADLSVYGVLSGGKTVLLGDNDVEWNVMYAKNLLDMDKGSIKALSPGETAVKAKLATSSITNEGKTYTNGLTDYVVVEIEYSSKSDLRDKISEAEEVLSTTKGVSGTKKKQLQSAIDDAKDVLNDDSSEEKDYTKAVTELSNAIESFKQPESSDGKRKTGGGGSYITYSVNVEPTEHGKVEVSQDKVYRGNSLTITATPDDGYVAASMFINGKYVGRKQSYTINSVADNITVKVVFAEKTDLPFIDVLGSDWYYEYVKDAYDFGYMNGTSETEFEPESVLTRAMFVTVLHRIEGEPQEGENVFEDVPENEYYKNAVAWANANGIVLGTEVNTFSPDENITREQMAAIFYRYAKYKEMDLTATESTNILSYTDYDLISEYAISAMQYTVGVGLIKGKTESTLNPLDNATRAEAATVFVRFADMLNQ